LAQAYGDRVAEKLGRWYRIERTRDGITLSNAQARVTDHGDRVTAARGNDREIGVLVKLAQAKGWKQVHLTGPADFQDRAAAAFIAAGIALDAPAMEARARQAAEAERRRQEQERLEQERQRQALEAERRRQEQERQQQAAEAERKRREQERRERLEAERKHQAEIEAEQKRQQQAAEGQKRQGAAHGQDYWAQLKKRVEAFWAERDAIAKEISRQAEAQLPEAKKRYEALETAFYATYDKPKEPPMIKVGWFKKIPDPQWVHPEDERKTLQKEMRAMNLSRLSDLAHSREAARKEADAVMKKRDPEGYERRIAEQQALEKYERDAALRRERQERERIERENQRGTGGRGDDN